MRYGLIRALTPLSFDSTGLAQALETLVRDGQSRQRQRASQER